MATRYRKDKKRAPKPWEAYWDNPITGKRETMLFATKAEAEAHSDFVKWRKKHDPESFRPANIPKPSAEGQTVADILGLYLASKYSQGIKDIQNGNQTSIVAMNYRAAFDHLKALLPHLANIPTAALTRADMRRAVAAVQDQGLAQSSIKRKVGIVKAALNWAAYEREIIPENPIAMFKCPQGKKPHIAPPTPGETRRILAASLSHMARAIILAWHFGPRVGRSELFGICWNNFYLEEDAPFVRITTANKGANISYKEMKVPEELIPLLLHWRYQDQEDGVEHLITWRGKPIKSIKTAWKTTLIRAGIERKIRPYDLRHAFYDEAVRASRGDYVTAARAMGHSSMRTGQENYRHVRTEEMDKVQDAIPSLADYGQLTGHMPRSHKNAVFTPFLCDQGKKVQ